MEPTSTRAAAGSGAAPTPATAPQARSPAGNRKIQELRITNAAREFEAVMLGQVVQIMSEGLGEGGSFGGGTVESQWRDILAQEQGRAMARAGGVGLAKQVAHEMKRAMGVEDGRPTPPATSPEPKP